MPTYRPSFDDEPTDPFAEYTRPRVLVAEDDPQLRGLVAARLRRGGLDVLEASSGQHALELLAPTMGPASTDVLRLAIMDVRMPGLSGIEVVYLLRQWRATVPVLLITAFPEPELHDEATRLGVELMAKPFAMDKLHAIATTTMRRAVGAA